ncbi:hypothetical protein [Georgenia sp. SYP-B2076]|uniref:hypothetical protein n=1 Tax=Georgenia sp. SYP-B2076 TaxID=2495881 RepID=UPI000F8DAF52|nr:hypothetical protein [Georgenia sp. SYP-B2076]
MVSVTVGDNSDGPAGVQTWTAIDGEGLVAQGRVAGAPDDVLTLDAAGGPQATAIVGTDVDGGRFASFLLTSTDRVTWTHVELDDATRSAQLGSVGVDATRIVAAGTGLNGRAPAAAVHTLGGATTTTNLTAPGDGQSLTISGVAVNGDHIVIVGALGPDGDVTRPIAYTSTDGGAAFTGPTEIASEPGEVSGVVWTGTEYLATGGAKESGWNRPAAWASADGVTWAREHVEFFGDETSDAGWGSDSADSTLRKPSVVDGKVAVAIDHDDSTWSYATLRDADGTWLPIPYWTAVMKGVGVSSSAVPWGDDGLIVVTQHWKAATQTFMKPGDVTQREITSFDAPFVIGDVHDLGGQIGISAYKPALVVDEGGGWRHTSDPGSYAFAPDGGIVEEAWGPADLATHNSPVTAADEETGSAVVAAGTTDDTGFPMHAWTRQGPEGEWQPAVGIDQNQQTFQNPTALGKTAHGWILAATTARTGAYDDARTATVWTSPDGLTWERAKGHFATDVGRGSGISDICELPDTPVAVGWSEDSAGVTHATAWKVVDGAWHLLTLTDSPGAKFTSCTVTEAGVRIAGNDGSRDKSWDTADLTSYTTAETLDEGSSRNATVEVPGGYVATGAVTTADFTGPVLWLSADGEEWDWIKIPSQSPTDWAQVHLAGEGLLVTATSGYHWAGGNQAWSVPDIGATLKALA